MLEERPIESCPECRYSWRGLPESGRCPECGFPRGPELRVWKQPKWALWSRPLLGLSICVGQGLPFIMRLVRAFSLGSAPPGFRTADMLLMYSQGILAALGLLMIAFVLQPACLTRYLAVNRFGLHVGRVYGSRCVAWERLLKIERVRLFVKIHVAGEPPIVFQKPVFGRPNDDFIDIARGRWEDWREGKMAG